jgi:hypothetical protein
LILNGIDLAGLGEQVPDALSIPDPVKGRVVHIDADFLAYQVSAEKVGLEGQKSLEDMKHNATLAINELKSLAGATAVHLHLTPASSDKGGRGAIALLKEYQGNRKGKPKPANLHIIRDWLGRAFPATQHQLCEADDGMSSAQYAAIEAGQRNLSIIASKDKDLNMVPGLHLNWDTGEIIDAPNYGKLHVRVRPSGGKVLDGYGRVFFWAQMLMGDAADNTSGLPAVIQMLGKPSKCGPMKALDILSGCRNDKDAYETVRDLYKRYGADIGFVNYRDQTPVQWGRALLSEAQLVWMRVTKHKALCVADYMQKVIAA